MMAINSVPCSLPIPQLMTNVFSLPVVAGLQVPLVVAGPVVDWDWAMAEKGSRKQTGKSSFIFVPSVSRLFGKCSHRRMCFCLLCLRGFRHLVCLRGQ